MAMIAIVSSDAVLADSIAQILRDDNTQVVHHHPSRANSERDTFKAQRPDIVVLDLAIANDMSSRIRYLRRRWPTIEIVAVNARNEADAQRILDAGADDVIHANSELLAPKLHAHARRARTVNAGCRLAVGDIIFDRESRRVWCAGEEVELTPRECALLDCMFWNATRPVSVTTLADFVWGDAAETDRRSAVEVYIGYIRKKLSASRKVVIRTVRQVGYQFDLLE